MYIFMILYIGMWRFSGAFGRYGQLRGGRRLLRCPGAPTLARLREALSQNLSAEPDAVHFTKPFRKTVTY